VLRPRLRRTALAAPTIALALAAAGGPAEAQTIFQADGTADLGYSATTGVEASSRTFAELRPALAVQTGSPRLAFRGSYLFAGSLTLTGSEPGAYSNTLGLSLAAEPTERTGLTVGASFSQGGTAFQLSQRSADAGQPAFRAPGNPSLVAASVEESFQWEATARFRLSQSLTGSTSAPQDDLGQYNASAVGSVALERVFESDAIGAGVRSSASQLRPLTPGAAPYLAITNALLADWNHDFDAQWNGEVNAGVEQVLSFAGSYPLAVVPTGTLTARYLGGAAGASLTARTGANADIQTGIVSLTSSVVLRGVVSFDQVLSRSLGASAGFARARALGVPAPRAAAGTGDALQADLGFSWALSEEVLATARYSLAYQFGQPSGLRPSLAHVLLVGITARYSNASYPIPMPTLGHRVDGRDAVGFPEGGERERKP
jgi:hypothetical protein